jgi:hypothetical protein
MVLEPVLDYDWSEQGARRRQTWRKAASVGYSDCRPAADLLATTWAMVAEAPARY